MPVSELAFVGRLITLDKAMKDKSERKAFHWTYMFTVIFMAIFMPSSLFSSRAEWKRVLNKHECDFAGDAGQDGYINCKNKHCNFVMSKQFRVHGTVFNNQ